MYLICILSESCMNTARREGLLLKTREDPWFSQSSALEASETLVITSTHNVRDTTSASPYFSYPTLPPRWRAGQADQAWAEKGRSRAPEGTTTCPEGMATRDNEDRVSPPPVPSLVLQI